VRNAYGKGAPKSYKNMQHQLSTALRRKLLLAKKNDGDQHNSIDERGENLKKVMF